MKKIKFDECLAIECLKMINPEAYSDLILTDSTPEKKGADLQNDYIGVEVSSISDSNQMALRNDMSKLLNNPEHHTEETRDRFFRNGGGECFGILFKVPSKNSFEEVLGRVYRSKLTKLNNGNYLGKETTTLFILNRYNPPPKEFNYLDFFVKNSATFCSIFENIYLWIALTDLRLYDLKDQTERKIKITKNKALTICDNAKDLYHKLTVKM